MMLVSGTSGRQRCAPEPLAQHAYRARRGLADDQMLDGPCGAQQSVRISLMSLAPTGVSLAWPATDRTPFFNAFGRCTSYPLT